MSDLKDPYCVSISATFSNENEGRRYQRVILEQYFESGEEMKSFQQQELLGIVADVGKAMTQFGDRHEAERKQKKGPR